MIMFLEIFRFIIFSTFVVGLVTETKVIVKVIKVIGIRLDKKIPKLKSITNKNVFRKKEK